MSGVTVTYLRPFQIAAVTHANIFHEYGAARKLMVMVFIITNDISDVNNVEK